MRIRFQADADLNQAILQGTTRREPTIDFQTANEAGLSGLNDREVWHACLYRIFSSE